MPGPKHATASRRNGVLPEKHRFVRYLAVGGINTGFSYGLYSLLLWSGVSYHMASLCAMVLGIFWSYTTQRAAVFGASGGSSLLRYLAAWSCLYFLNIGIIACLKHLGINDYVAGLVATPPVAIMSYFVLKLVVFSNDEPGSTGHPRQ